MSTEESFSVGNWGAVLVRRLVHPLTTIATPIFLLVLTVYFVATAFKTDIYTGVRSLSAALIPLIMVTFTSIFVNDILTKLRNANVLLSFLTSFVWAIFVMIVIRVFGSLVPSPFPLSELVLSGSFAILVFSYAETQTKGENKNNRVLAYYYGMIMGFLVYIVFAGFPSTVFRT